MKFPILILALLLVIPVAVLAQENPLPQEFWGNVTYSDGTTVPNGSILIASSQAGYELGKWTLTQDGRYGAGERKYDKRMVVRGAMGDRIYFYVGLEPAVNGFVYFISGDITYHDIIIMKPKPTPTPPPTPTPTPTPVPTTIAPTPSPSPTPTPTPAPAITFTGLTNTDLETILVGALLAVIMGTVGIFALFYWVFKKHGLGEETDEERYRQI
jgi:hypothetical protein